MKWIYRIFTLIILGGALAIPFFMKNKQGEPMMSLPGVKDLTPSALVSNPPSLKSDRTVYKWKDKNGVWHYGDQAPDGAQFSTLVVDDKTNIIQSTPVPKETAAAEVEAPKKDSKKPAYQPPKDNEDVLTLDRALNIVDDAHAVREMMEQRNQHLDSVIGNRDKK